ncbi:MAG TPA: SRPBCC family protein [Chitinophagaceae bacterium]|nr:SRPBCC family protein [Chitinophagaceae bacterium]
MPLIHLTTFIKAPIERVFDLCRNVDLQKQSMKHHGEEAVAGTRFGLIGKDETVTWKGKHLFKTRVMRLRVTDMQKPLRFVDEQADGSFKIMKHEHHFKSCENGTIMIDLFQFESPYGTLGKLVNSFYLTHYVKKLLQHRNKLIKEYAEGNKWKWLLEK